MPYYRHYNGAPYVGLNLLCMLVGFFFAFATWNPIVGLLAYLIPLYTIIQINEHRK